MYHCDQGPLNVTSSISSGSVTFYYPNPSLCGLSFSLPFFTSCLFVFSSEPWHLLLHGKDVTGWWKCWPCPVWGSTAVSSSAYLLRGNHQGLEVDTLGYYPSEDSFPFCGKGMLTKYQFSIRGHVLFKPHLFVSWVGTRQSWVKDIGGLVWTRTLRAFRLNRLHG